MAMFGACAGNYKKTRSDTTMAVISSDDLDGDYERMKSAGVTFIGAPKRIKRVGNALCIL